MYVHLKQQNNTTYLRGWTRILRYRYYVLGTGAKAAAHSTIPGIIQHSNPGGGLGSGEKEQWELKRRARKVKYKREAINRWEKIMCYGPRSVTQISTFEDLKVNSC